MSGTADRRSILGGIGALALAPSAARAAEEAGWRRYALETEVDLASADAPADLWVPVFESVGAHQRAGRIALESEGRARRLRDARYGAPLVHVTWETPGGGRRLRVRQEVAVRDRALEPARLTPAERRLWTAPTASAPTGGIVGETAARIIGARTAPREKARAIYDWVVENTFRDAATRGCGIGGVEGMLRSGFLGGKCADINGLMVGLCRAAGLPARDAYGVRLGPSRLMKALGPSGPDVTHAQHCRAEVWLEEEGWLPVDPADVRKAALEAKLMLESPELSALRERLFGAWEMNWAAYNHATDIVLPGASAPPREHFLMYPLAMTPKGELDQLDPESFRYSLRATQLA